MYTTFDPALRSAAEPIPCDTFTYGQLPVAVVQGFGHVPETMLEVLTDGRVISRKTIPLDSGKVLESHLSSDFNYSSLGGHYVEQDRLTKVMTAGAKVELGALAPGNYDLMLKTNGVAAAVAHFKVNTTPAFEVERQKVESERVKLRQAVDQLKQLGAEIEAGRALVDQTNPRMVAEFNNKVAHYNQLSQQAKADQEQFNSKVKAFNDRLKGESIEALLGL